MSVGSVIRSQRKAFGWSQREFARELTATGMPVDSSRVSRLEGGDVDPRFSEVLIICRVLDLTPNDLAGVGSNLARTNETATAVLNAAIQKLTELKEQVRA